MVSSSSFLSVQPRTTRGLLPRRPGPRRHGRHRRRCRETRAYSLAWSCGNLVTTGDRGVSFDPATGTTCYNLERDRIQGEPETA